MARALSAVEMTGLPSDLPVPVAEAHAAITGMNTSTSRSFAVFIYSSLQVVKSLSGIAIAIGIGIEHVGMIILLDFDSDFDPD
jgi:hypothetical protein